MKKFIFAVVAIMGLGVISCSHNNHKSEETAQVEEEEIGCLCCEVEAPADSVDIME
ncbi:MAG: hypothetical protein J1E16_10575 [Muribaculaceae bacterium]|nr:hypothetical protein [Muribaculaceae bacterium]